MNDVKNAVPKSELAAVSSTILLTVLFVHYIALSRTGQTVDGETTLWFAARHAKTGLTTHYTQDYHRDHLLEQRSNALRM